MLYHWGGMQRLNFLHSSTNKNHNKNFQRNLVSLELLSRYCWNTIKYAGGESHQKTSVYCLTLFLLINTRRYSPLRGLSSSSCGGLRPTAEAFYALRAKKELFMLFWLTLGHFWCSVVTSVTFSSNLSNFEKNSKNPKKIQKNSKIPKI